MAKTDSSDLLDLIGRTYDAALDETLWSGLASQIARTFGSSSAALRIRNERTGNAPLLTWTKNMVLPADVMEQYKSHYWRRDVWANRAAELGLSQVFTSEDLIHDAALERTEFYRDWLRRFHIFYIVGAILPIGANETCSFGVHRERTSGNYSEQDKLPVAQYLPHLRRALQIRRRFTDAAIERYAALDALERTATATLVLDADGRILYANTEAEILLRSGDTLRSIGGRLATNSRSTSERLSYAIADAAKTAAGKSGSSGAGMTIARADRLPLTLLVAPFRPARNAFGAPRPAAILFIRDPEQSTPSRLALQDLFGLTGAEASIAMALADGMSLDSIAKDRYISLNTARTHLKNVLAKTGTNRQSQLVALLLRSAAMMASE